MAIEKQRLLLEQALRNAMDAAVKQGNLEKAVAISDVLVEPVFEGVLGDQELEALRISDGYRNAFQIADAVYRGDRDIELEPPLPVNEDQRVYGDLGPQSGTYDARRQRSKKGKADPLNINLYLVAKEAGINPQNAYEHLEGVRRLLVEQRQMSAIVTGPGKRESVYSTDKGTTAKVVKTFSGCYERGKKLSEG